MKKLISLLLAASISFCLAACGNSASLPNNSEAGPGNDSQGDVKRITIGTAGTSGALYPMGVAMAETITNHVNESTAASIENLRNLHDGKMAMGISMSEICAYAYHGQADYEGSDYSDIRAMFSTINNYLQVFTLKDSGITSVEDLKGKTVSMGSAGSGGEMAGRMLHG